ncbi:Threonine--tRNA ligase [Trichinella spiralis]|uniref:Threonine--tRNA ligase n=1 Tax=Trichinella spiralis TaxID=6334 RepID=A0ABR3K7X3_TRISP
MQLLQLKMASSKCIFIFLHVFFFLSLQETNGLKSALKKSGSNQGRHVVFNPDTKVAVIPDKIDAEFVAPVESILEVHKEQLKPGILCANTATIPNAERNATTISRCTSK